MKELNEVINKLQNHNHNELVYVGRNYSKSDLVKELENINDNFDEMSSRLAMCESENKWFRKSSKEDEDNTL